MITKDQIEIAARRLREADANKKVCDPIRDLIGDDNLNAAYAIQQINSKLKADSGAKIVGHKIGLTSLSVQQQLGVNQPDFGLLWHDKEVLNGGEVSMTQLMQPKAEGEIAFMLNQDLNSDSLTSIDVLNAIEYMVPAIEIVGSRIRDWDLKITDTIADNASASHWVIGHQPKLLRDVDLINCKLTVTQNGVKASEGIGKACLGSPINAVLWLAKKMIEMGQSLHKGDLILSGALGPLVDISAGDHIIIEIEDLGSVSVNFTE